MIDRKIRQKRKFKSELCSRYQMIQSYPGKSSIISEFESSSETTRINQKRTWNKTEMEDATI